MLGSPLDDGDDGPRRDRRRLSRADPGGRGAGARHLVRRLMRLAAGGPRAGLQGRADRRGGRRGPGRLRLVQDADDPRAARPACRSRPSTRRSASLVLAAMRRRPAARPAASRRSRGVRPAQQDLYELIGPGASRSSTPATCGAAWATTSPTPTSTSPTTGSAAGHPLNQSLYVGYKVMLAGLLMICQGGPDRDELVGRDAVPVPRRRRDRLLRGDRPRVQAARAGPRSGSCGRSPRGPCPPRIANRPKTMFRASLSEDLPRPATGPPGSTSSSAPSRSARPATSTPRASPAQRAAQTRIPRDHARAGSSRRGPDLRRLDPALAPHLSAAAASATCRPGPRRRSASETGPASTSGQRFRNLHTPPRRGDAMKEQRPGYFRSSGREMYYAGTEVAHILTRSVSEDSVGDLLADASG